MFVPHELSIGEVFIPPLLVAGVLGVIAASITVRFLNRYRLSRYFFYPPLAMLALVAIYTVLFGWIVVPY